ncbi:isocitrate dehydrogenase [Pseudomonas fluvialis]|uniref:Isocitrate dehydrogenase [NADP] n=1 Tax=Pseudomonas fluvialis TaxID=1793966 RepID=A0A2I0CLN6_9PSED|nr:NADP-dependent isocitrate dehydrogenase [Pseudomonas pharmacofabricae]PKF70069.1 isocitrate dehydrogenase [Pseudomonas pharmacofabricae]
MHKTPIAVAYGDGIGPEIMEATLRILDAAGAAIAPEVIEVGEAVYKRGELAGIAPEAWESLRRTKVFLKAPITTPQGGGYKSLNVTTRKALGLYANVRPCVAYAPFVQTRHPTMDLVIVRENEEDLYAGIEHRQTDEVFQCLKLISRPGCERIVRYAFDYARQQGRRKVSCFVKDNIMKFTDGLFHQVFEEIGREYPDLEQETWIVDIGAAKLADTPEQFDVVVMPNLYGDILSDVAAQIAGSVGMAGSANIGEQCAMFEAIHGSAPRRAGQNLANPSGLLQGAVQMLLHIGQGEVASRVQNAWLRTLEEGLHTYDIFDQAHSRKKLGTREFADAVIARLGQRPEMLRAVDYPADSRLPQRPLPERPPAHKQLVGVDVFLHQRALPAAELGVRLQRLGAHGLPLSVITNRGVKVWPNGFAETTCVDHWRCRFLAPAGQAVDFAELLALQTRLNLAGFEPIKTENLYTFDGEPGYAAVHG